MSADDAETRRPLLAPQTDVVKKEDPVMERRKRWIWYGVAAALLLAVAWYYFLRTKKAKSCKLKRKKIGWADLEPEVRAILASMPLKRIHRTRALQYVKSVIESEEFQNDPAATYQQQLRLRGPRHGPQSEYYHGYDDALKVLDILIPRLCE